MKFFSRQLLVKHVFLRQFEGEGEVYRQAERQIDALIDLGHFLSIADLEARSIQVRSPHACDRAGAVQTMFAIYRAGWRCSSVSCSVHKC